jgi:hypothetical protein
MKLEYFHTSFVAPAQRISAASAIPFFAHASTNFSRTLIGHRSASFLSHVHPCEHITRVRFSPSLFNHLSKYTQQAKMPSGETPNIKRG